MDIAQLCHASDRAIDVFPYLVVFLKGTDNGASAILAERLPFAEFSRKNVKPKRLRNARGDHSQDHIFSLNPTVTTCNGRNSHNIRPHINLTEARNQSSPSGKQSCGFTSVRRHGKVLRKAGQIAQLTPLELLRKQTRVNCEKRKQEEKSAAVEATHLRNIEEDTSLLGGKTSNIRERLPGKGQRDRTSDRSQDSLALVAAPLYTRYIAPERAIGDWCIAKLLEEDLDKNKRQDPPSKAEVRPIMTHPEPPESPSKSKYDKPLVVGRTKPIDTSTSKSTSEPPKMAPLTADTKAELNQIIEENVQANTKTAAPAEAPDSNPTLLPPPKSQPTTKKEKAPKQPKQPKAAPPTAPLSPALIDLRVGHILRCITHPNADSLFVSTIAMGDAEGDEHSHKDEETGQIVRTVCSGLNGLVPLAEMQDRKVIVVANLKPVTMRGIKSAAMVLAASPKMEEGADPHAADRVVELVSPPPGTAAGDKVYFESWEYGEGKGPEKQLNPKKKVWESLQPGFFTSDDCSVGFDAAKSEMEGSTAKGWLIVDGKGKCTVKSLTGAVVR